MGRHRVKSCVSRSRRLARGFAVSGVLGDITARTSVSGATIGVDLARAKPCRDADPVNELVRHELHGHAVAMACSVVYASMSQRHGGQR
jgi:hypothetical protein